MAIPNAVLTLIVGTLLQGQRPDGFNADGASNAFEDEYVHKASQVALGAISGVMIFILYNRSRTSYNRWWEGGTLLQKTRGEWFNAYSSIMAFTSSAPEMQNEVESYRHLLARLFSLLMCCGLQQVSPCRDRPFEVIHLAGIEQESIDFLNSAPDKVEVIMQWIQRSIVVHMNSGVLPVAPPVLSRAFQEVSRGIVNLQNARKIADFPYPYPLAQISMVLQLVHWAVTPVAASLALPRFFAMLFSFVSIFVLWCIHFNALDLEFPFGSRVNDLPMNEMQQDWNNSIVTLLDKKATRPPCFDYDPAFHEELDIAMSDASPVHAHVPAEHAVDRGVSFIIVCERSPVNSKPNRKTVRMVERRNSLEKGKDSIDSKMIRESAELHSEALHSAALVAAPVPVARSDMVAGSPRKDKAGPDIPSNDVDLAVGSQPTPASSSQPPKRGNSARAEGVRFEGDPPSNDTASSILASKLGAPARTNKYSVDNDDIPHESSGLVIPGPTPEAPIRIRRVEITEEPP